MADPYFVQIATSDLAELDRTLELLGEHADLNHRYRKMLDESRELLAQPEIRLTQARGLAKRLLVLVKAAGPTFRDDLDEPSRRALEAGLTQANTLIFEA